jgi:hypothetical protein
MEIAKIPISLLLLVISKKSIYAAINQTQKLILIGLGIKVRLDLLQLDPRLMYNLNDKIKNKKIENYI